MDLKDLKVIWGKNDFRPNKRLGQNFLIDKNIRNKILSELHLNGDEFLLEVGPGFGVMTFELAKRCREIVAVEKDALICRIMRPFFEEENIKLVTGDILEFDIKGSMPKGKTSILFGNIPYYISTPLVERIIENKKLIKSAYIVMQEEVVDRIIASPGSKTYGSLSCFVRYFTKPDKLFRIKNNSFYPSPKVSSALLKLEILDEPSVKVRDEDLMFSIIRKAFSQRRKKAVNPLSDVSFLGIDKNIWETLFNRCDMSPSLRAEDIALSDYARLADEVFFHRNEK
ncbi:MAG: 16S rRNA (adenine(1518)-N(6)/adenine(1519)-N(6))-dimethyltransferase RsmA [Candidatus Omnitrophota bacterium]